MNGSPAQSTTSGLARWITALALGGCSLAVFGAGRANPSPALTIPSYEMRAKTPVAAPVQANRELIQEVAPSTLAAETTAAASVGPHKKVVWLEVTAYCSCPKCCGPNARGLTASGRSIAYNGGRFVAADTKLFKFGTQLSIPGYAGGEPVEVIDRGGAIKGLHVDVFFPTHEQARAWGRQRLAVTVEE